MSRIHNLSLSTLVLAAVVPFVWVACGGGKPPETPADESASNGDGGEATDSGAAPAASSAASNDDSAPAASSSAPAAPPPPPPFGGTDCGKCVDKVCAATVKACGKNTDCQSTLDGIHSCGSDTGAAQCIANATNPPSGKPKKLAAAYEACAKKAVAGKTCKTKCQ
jgi:hypothetical protein